MAKAATRPNNRPPEISTELEKIIAGDSVAQSPPEPVPPQEVISQKINDETTEARPESGGISRDDWKKKKAAKLKTTVVRCVVIDLQDHWHQDAMIDLRGMDTTAFTWGYYGVDYPILVEQESGTLKPFYLPDSAGESSNRLYKGANPDGFKATFKHRGNLLQKLQVGLMVALVLGLFGIMFVLIGM